MGVMITCHGDNNGYDNPMYSAHKTGVYIIHGKIWVHAQKGRVNQQVSNLTQVTRLSSLLAKLDSRQFCSGANILYSSFGLCPRPWRKS